MHFPSLLQRFFFLCGGNIRNLLLKRKNRKTILLLPSLAAGGLTVFWGPRKKFISIENAILA
jgi:hypothetical protein